jgi:ABC-type sugar transport system ATPase subunit
MVNTSKPVLELKKISKHFTGVAALSGISFNVSPGEVLCLLG